MSCGGSVMIVDGVEVPVEGVAGEVGEAVVEAPPGLKWLALRLASMFGWRASLRPVWGSCDFRLGTWDVVHVGHGVPPNVLAFAVRSTGGRYVERGEVGVLEVGGSSVYFVPAYYRLPEEHLDRLAEAVNVEGTVFYPVLYRRVAEGLARRRGLPLAGRPMTGCWVGDAPGDAALVVSSGLFYGLAVKLFFPGARVYAVDPFQLRVVDVEPAYRRVMALRAANRAALEGARRVALVVTVKPGQRPDASWAAAALRAMGKEVVVVEADEVTPELLSDLDVDLAVNAACPRIGLDDLDRMYRPVINLGDLRAAARRMDDPRAPMWWF